MDLRKLKTLIDLVSESSISELEITEADGKIRIVKPNPQSQAPIYQVPVTMPAVAAQTGPLSNATPQEVTAPVIKGHTIKSPMVGTYYGASSPGAAPFVAVGTNLKEGQPVCIIEAMKIMNEIESDISGTVTQVLCENGQAVEFGQPLFIVE